MTAVGSSIQEAWFNTSYSHGGFSAQRRIPSEELLRFLGRHYFSIPPTDRSAIRALEVGCGSGANLWMLAREGFEVHGLDLSREAIALCRQMLNSWNVEAALAAADMTHIPYCDEQFDIIADVFASYCLDEAGARLFHQEVARLLRPGGRVFPISRQRRRTPSPIPARPGNWTRAPSMAFGAPSHRISETSIRSAFSLARSTRRHSQPMGCGSTTAKRSAGPTAAVVSISNSSSWLLNGHSRGREKDYLKCCSRPSPRRTAAHAGMLR
jgi:SAM-dependent methyltransferase